MKKKIISIMLAIVTFSTLAQEQNSLHPFFRGEIYDIYLSYGKCSQNDIECDDITYHSINKKTKAN